MRSAAAVLVLVAACGGGSGPPGGATAVRIASLRDVGRVANPALAGVTRAGGAAGRVGDRILWSFGDTRLTAPAEDGATLRSSTGAYSELAAPTQLSEPVDARGAPRPLLPFDAAEQAYNAGSGDPDERYALRPTAVLPFAENGLIVYARLLLHAGGAAEPVLTGMALVRPGSTTAERYPEVFLAPEPPFSHAAALDAGDLHLYACSAASGRCRVARAPFERATERAAYTFWTGAGWSPEVALASEDVPGSTTGFSVAYNTYLERFVALATAPGSGRVELRTAPQPEGPWSAPIVVTDLGAAVVGTVQHPELAAAAGRTIFFSYQRADELRLVEVNLE